MKPENQKKLLAEHERIKEECIRIEAWHMQPEEAMKLTPEQISFLRQHNITVSTAYMGMVRLYVGNSTIFQTSPMASIVRGLAQVDVINYESLASQTHAYLNLLMNATPELQTRMLAIDMPLFGNGELDAIRDLLQRAVPQP